MRIKIVDANGLLMRCFDISNEEPFADFFKYIRDISFDQSIVFVYADGNVISNEDTPMSILYNGRDSIIAQYEIKERCILGKDIGYF